MRTYIQQMWPVALIVGVALLALALVLTEWMVPAGPRVISDPDVWQPPIC
jgi:hypothetical protein